MISPIYHAPTIAQYINNLLYIFETSYIINVIDSSYLNHTLRIHKSHKSHMPII